MREHYIIREMRTSSHEPYDHGFDYKDPVEGVTYPDPRSYKITIPVHT